ncbi:sodium/potassium-transporting ATPase subunit alpha-like isoform X1 [Maniola jurtina]|uniref:sodium/potassium-transporting ATPase subunit alpha-like isoform X1 n=1 Tax=Maniola jurtina TaxID=191418 RepID=UPI001E68687A|nr:sodium/potassium-transporting ATPase subunit alpha-like isoform X1 [Maniola jurtina]
MNSKSSSLSSISDLFRPTNPRGLRSRDLSSTRLSVLKQEIQTDTHLIPLKNLYTLLGTDPINGLTNNRAKELLEYYGPNTLTPTTQFLWPRLLFKSLCTGFSIVIWLGAILCLTAYLIELSTKPDPRPDNLYLGCVLIAVDLICGLFSFFQNYKSSQILKTFNSMIPMYAKCTRDGVLTTDTEVHNLVKGDIVYVEIGDVIPADIRIIESKGFKVDNSSLTGECIAVSRSNTDGTPNILESPNVAFSSALCVEGWAKGVVICCGDLTALGRVAGLAARLKPAPSPLSREIRRFMRCMSAWAIGLGVFIAGASLALGYPFMQTTVFVIGIIVANIPEGLQPTVTASLTLTAKRMVAKQCLIKNLEAIEALGACTTICSDKTGTLTENKMCVRHIWMPDKTYSVLDDDFDSSLQNNQAFISLKVCGALCSNASVSSSGVMRGDASEKAILNFLINFDDPIAIRKMYPKVAEIPFNSVNKYQVSVHLDTSTSKFLVVIKGAPECIVSRCLSIIVNNEITDMSTEIKEAANVAIENLANTGERILAFADCVLDPEEFPLDYKFDTENVNFPLDNLRFLGLIGLKDPPREEVRFAIQRVREAGVRVMMVTGDHPATARAVASEVGIATTPDCHVVTGTDLRNMTPDLLYLTLEKHYEIVFARTSPTQKLTIVEACQRQGGVVAVTGDGVNDAPALRRADIGISMGITGSQVSKQTADIILMDDNFATIVTGIEEGRKIFDNLKKSVCYILISNVPEIIPVLMFILFSIPLPLGVMTILCVDLGTDMWPAVSLSYEQAEQDVMARPPRTSDPLVSASMLRLAYGHLGLVEFAAGMFAYFIVMAEHGFYPSSLFGIRERWDNEAVSDVEDSLGQEWTYAERKELERACQAAYFVAVVITQMMNGVICKTRYNSLFHVGMKNNVLKMGLLVELMLACAVCYVPGVNTFFRTYPLRLRWWFLALPFAAFMFVFDEFRKYCIRRQNFGRWFNKLIYY